MDKSSLSIFDERGHYAKRKARNILHYPTKERRIRKTITIPKDAP